MKLQSVSKNGESGMQNEFLSYTMDGLITLAMNTTAVRKLDGEEMQQLIEALGSRLWEIKNVVTQ